MINLIKELFRPKVSFASHAFLTSFTLVNLLDVLEKENLSDGAKIKIEIFKSAMLRQLSAEEFFKKMWSEENEES